MRSRSRRSQVRAAVVASLVVILSAGVALPASAGAPPGGGDASLPAIVQPPKKCADASDKAGWAGLDLVVATAVALAESGCDPAAASVNGPTQGCPDGSTDRGIFQINSCYHSEVSDACAYNRGCNARAAYAIWDNDHDSFNQWTVYIQRTFKSHLTEARKAVKKVTGESIAVGVVMTEGDVLIEHAKPRTSSEAVGSLENSAVILINCQTKGELVHGTVFDYDTKIWDKVDGGGYVSDGYVYTDSSSRVAKPC